MSPLLIKCTVYLAKLLITSQTIRRILPFLLCKLFPAHLVILSMFLVLVLGLDLRIFDLIYVVYSKVHIDSWRGKF